MNKDTHQELGPKEFVRFDEMLTLVRRRWPTASVEDSTGFERSFWVNGGLVAHAWPIYADWRDEAMWIRIKDYEITKLS